MDRLSSIFKGMDRVQRALDVNPERRMSELGFDFHEPTRPVELNGDQGPYVVGGKRLCKYCPASDVCPLTEDEDGKWVSRCGIEHSSFASEDVSARNFAGDDQATRDKRAQSSVMYDEQRRELVHINTNQVGVDVEKEVLWKAGNRLNQTAIWLKFVRDERPGSFFLTSAEVTNAQLAMKAACTRWAKDGGNETAFGSPVFWAIVIILEMVAKRPGGFNMPSPALRDLCTMDGLHEFFRARKGQAMVTDESEFSATRARGQSADAQRQVNHVKRRQARFDELGHARQGKIAILSQLIARARIWPNPEATAETPDQARYLGLSSAVRSMQTPGLLESRDPNFVPEVVSLRPIKIGTDLDAPVLRTTTASAPPVDASALNTEPDAPMPLAPVAASATEAARAAEAAAAAKVAQMEAALQAARETAASATAATAAAEAAEAEKVSDEDLPDGFGENDAEWDEMVAKARSDALADRAREEQAVLAADASGATAVVAVAEGDDDAPSLRNGRPKWTPIKGELKKATLYQMLHSTQWQDQDREKAEAFWKRWQDESRAWRAEQAEKLRRRKDVEELKARERAKREAARVARLEEDQAKYDKYMEMRSFQRSMTQGADRERKEKRRMGELSVQSGVTDKRAKTIGKITITQAPVVASAGCKKSKAALRLLDEAAGMDNWIECESCGQWRMLPPGHLKPKQGTFFVCSHINEMCEPERKPPGRR
jgi:hypothetical protein